MPINPTIFKSYDIRGIYPSELNEEVAFQIGREFAKKTKAKNMVLGYDARLSSLTLMKAFATGAMAEGAKIFNIGQVPTECVYFSVGNYDFDTGVMVTASHNPKEYNGFKMLKKDGDKIAMIRGKDLASVVEQNSGQEVKIVEPEKKDIWKDYWGRVLSFSDLSEISPLKIIVDASNGVAGSAISKIKDKLPVEIIDLNFEPDGNFPNHSPNPLEKDSVNKIAETIKSEKADFGLMFDGDGDRIFLVDEQGNLVRADVVLLLLAKYFLKKNPGMAVAYNAICSRAVPNFVKKWGGIPIRTQVGFVNVRDSLMQNNGIMGGELSGHYCFKDYYYMDSGMIAFLILLQNFSKDSRSVSEIVKELSPYVKSPELNFKIDNKEEVLEKVKQKYTDGKQDYLDGVTVEYDNWWFNVRPSNTEPLLRLTIEANTVELLADKKRELIKFISA